MSLRFLADQNFSRPILSGVKRREPAIDLVRVQDIGLKNHPDPDILAFAAREGRVLLSHDYRAMPEHFREFAAKQSSAGVFLFPQRVPVADSIDTLMLIWAVSRAEEWENRLVYLPL